VAKLAGIPSDIIVRSYEILNSLESPQQMITRPALCQPNLFGDESHPILDELDKLQVDDLTPRQALEILYRWKEIMGK